MHSFKYAAVAALLAAANLAQATQLSVTGAVAPASAAACAAHISGNIGHGLVDPSALKTGELTKLPSRTLQYSIQCTVPTLIALAWHDERRGTSNVTAPISIPTSTFGLGLHKGAKVGHYKILMGRPGTTADELPARMLRTLRDDVWDSSWLGFVRHGVGERYSYKRLEAPDRPQAFQQYSGSIIVHTWIAQAETLDLDEHLPLDGQATLELQYL